MVVRAYPIGDLVAPPPIGNHGRPLMLKNVEAVKNLIKVAWGDEDLWITGGATMHFHEESMALIIRAPAIVHSMLFQR
jgi:hypothetical protein